MRKLLIRFFDVVFSGTAVVMLSPLLLAIMLVLRFTGEGEVFYRQQRVGRNGEMFGLLKFATMLKNSPNIGTGVLTLKQDPRILPFGRFLRKTKFNELPQLINVLCGHMSLIGPRPQARPHFEVFPDHIKVILKTVKPGLSGIGAIVFRDEENVLDLAQDKEAFYANVIAPYKGDIEVWYIERESLILYFTLIFLTAWVVLVSSSTLHRRLLQGLPNPPAELKGL